MAARRVYGDRQMRGPRVSDGSVADVVWFGTLAAVTVGILLRQMGEPQRRTTCAIRAAKNLDAFSRVCPRSAGS
jgi:hypothetical protein